MLPEEPILFHGCRRCDGLFTSVDGFSQHVVICTGNQQKSGCELFACPKEAYLRLLNTQTPTRQSLQYQNKKGDPSLISKIPPALRDFLPNPMKKVTVIGFIKKPKRVVSQIKGNLDSLVAACNFVDVNSRTDANNAKPKLIERNVSNVNCSDVYQSCENTLPKFDSQQINNYSVPLNNSFALQETSDSEPQPSNIHVHQEITQQNNDPLQNKNSVPLQTNRFLPQQENCFDPQQANSFGPQQANSLVPQQANSLVPENNVSFESQRSDADCDNYIENMTKQTGDDFADENHVLHYPEPSDGLAHQDEEQEQAVPEEAADDQTPEELDMEDCQWEKVEKDGSAVFVCKQCGHQSRSQGIMQRHLRVHNKQKEFLCLICGYTTVWKNAFVTHSRTHQEPSFLCEKCPRTFKSKSSLNRHLAKKHEVAGKSNLACYFSADCKFVGSSRANLRDHMRKHTGEKLSCDQCRFQTSTEKVLALHKAKHQGITRYICEVCGYKTIESGTFKRHSMIHTGQKMFKCPDCSYRASTRYVVIKHVYGKHLNLKRYACNRCDYKTAYYSGLSMHLMAHEGIKPFKCSLCSYRSNVASKVGRHCAQKHAKMNAKPVKVENLLRFDIKDYMNPELARVNVKVICLGEGEEVEEEKATEEAPAMIDPDLGTEDSLMCGGQMTSETGGVLGHMMDPNFGLSNFPLDQNYQEDSNSGFITRPSRLDCNGDQDLNKVLGKPKVSYLDSPDSSLPIIGLEQSIADMAGGKSNSFSGFEYTHLGLRSDSYENLSQLKPASSIQDFTNIVTSGQLMSTDYNYLPVRTQIPQDASQQLSFPTISESLPSHPGRSQSVFKSLLPPKHALHSADGQYPMNIPDPHMEGEIAAKNVLINLSKSDSFST